ncbi:MAG TPA: DUF99 family protein [Candidatus Lokiarchaeia archaeon]|nr:DUF99 family protein [Candidatus Lokiarchaeia archaeon]
MPETIYAEWRLGQIMLHAIKPGIQVVAIDDKVHQKCDATTKLAFVFCAGTMLEKVMSAEIDVDGMNATDTIISTLEPFKDQFRLILLHGITVGGLNIVDIEAVHEVLGHPVIAVTENEPEGDTIFEAIKHAPGEQEHRALIEKAGPMHVVKPRPRETDIYYYVKGIDEKLAGQYLKKFAMRSRLPECLLLAHKIATGL